MRLIQCPVCDEDITESYQEYDPDVGIMSSWWYCDKCDEFVGDEYEPLEDDVAISFKPQPVPRCPEHPEEIPEMGYGLAGGGMGPYSYCPSCGRVITKSQDIEPKPEGETNG